MHFNKIATHHRTDSDELAGIWIAARFGMDLLSQKFSVEFTDAGTRTPDGKPVETWMEKGFLPIGIWGSPFDEHRNGSRPRRHGECAATLMAKYLGVSEDLKLKPILKYILDCDYGKRDYQDDGLSVLVKKIHWLFPTQPLVVMDWFFQAMDVKYGDSAEPDNFSIEYIYKRMLSLGYSGAEKWYGLAQDAMEAQRIHFGIITPAEFSKGEVLTVPGYNGKVNVSVVLSDDELIWPYSKTKDGGRCGVLIQKKSTGNVQIFSDWHVRQISLVNVAPIIRKLEMTACGRHSRNPHCLRWEGSSVYGAECWCFMHDIFLFNGSLTAPNVKPTKLSLEQIIDGVCEGLTVKKPQKTAA